MDDRTKASLDSAAAAIVTAAAAERDRVEATTGRREYITDLILRAFCRAEGETAAAEVADELREVIAGREEWDADQSSTAWEWISGRAARAHEEVLERDADWRTWA